VHVEAEVDEMVGDGGEVPLVRAFGIFIIRAFPDAAVVLVPFSVNVSVELMHGAVRDDI
jgi:hypothetical protein